MTSIVEWKWSYLPTTAEAKFTTDESGWDQFGAFAAVSTYTTHAHHLWMIKFHGFLQNLTSIYTFQTQFITSFFFQGTR